MDHTDSNRMEARTQPVQQLSLLMYGQFSVDIHVTNSTGRSQIFRLNSGGSS